MPKVQHIPPACQSPVKRPEKLSLTDRRRYISGLAAADFWYQRRDEMTAYLLTLSPEQLQRLDELYFDDLPPAHHKYARRRMSQFERVLTICMSRQSRGLDPFAGVA